MARNGSNIDVLLQARDRRKSSCIRQLEHSWVQIGNGRLGDMSFRTQDRGTPSSRLRVACQGK
jgi:hypothetical protein